MLKFAKIDVTASGDNIIVVGSTYPNRRIRILSFNLITDADVIVKFKSGASGDLTGPMPLAAYGGIATTSSYISNIQPIGQFETLASNDNLILNLSGAANIGGNIVYYVLTG
jgi:hypothetical protein